MMAVYRNHVLAVESARQFLRPAGCEPAFCEGNHCPALLDDACALPPAVTPGGYGGQMSLQDLYREAAIYMRCKPSSSRILVNLINRNHPKNQDSIISSDSDIISKMTRLGVNQRVYLRRLGSSCCTLDNGLPADEEWDGFIVLFPPPPPRSGFAILPAT